MPRRIFAIVAYLIGIAGAALFMLYVLAAGTGCIACADQPDDGALPWLNNLFLLSLFAAQHTGMARQSYKNFIVKIIPASLERSLYVAMSGTVLLLLTLFWAPLPGEPIWHGPLWIAGISILGVVAVGAFSLRFDHAQFFGLTSAEAPAALHTDGPYRFVRHPLMLALLVAIWGQPIMPPELLMLNVGMSLYIVVAIRLEERDLVTMFGPEYERYRKTVPALIPFANRLLPV